MKFVGDPSSAVAASNAVAAGIDQVNAAAAKSTSGPQTSINKMFGLDGTQVVRQTEQDIASFGAQLDVLRAKFNPLFAAEQKHNAVLADMQSAFKVGAIDSEELTAAVAAENAAFDATVASIGNSGGALSGHAAASGHVSTQSMAASHAVRGMVEQMALGVSPTQALTAQLNHLTFAASGEGGLVGAFKGLGAAFAPLLEGPNLIAIGAIGAGIAVSSLWGALSGSGEQSAEEALKRHKDLIDAIAAAYPVAADAAKKYETQAGLLTPNQALSQASDDLKAQTAAYAKAMSALKGALQADLAAGQDQYTTDANGSLVYGSKQHDAAQQAVQDFLDGKKTVKELQDQLAALKIPTDLHSDTANEISSFQRLVDVIAQADGKVGGLHAAMVNLNEVNDSFANLAAGNAKADPNGNNASFAADQLAKTVQSADAYKVQLAAITAMGPAQQAQIAMKQKSLELDGQVMSTALRQQEIDQAGAIAFAQSQHAIDEADRSRLQAANDNIATARSNLALVGQSLQATSQQQFAQQNLAAAQDEAAKNNTTVSAAYIIQIKAIAAAYGQLQQKIALAQLSDNLSFDRSQLGRTTGDQAIASQLRPIFGDDLSGAQAQFYTGQLRVNAALADMKATGEDLTKGFLSDFQNDLKNGTSLLGSLADAAGNAFLQIATKFEESGIDQLFASAFGGSSSSSSGWIGTILGAFGLGGGSNIGGNLGKSPVGSADNLLGFASGTNSAPGGLARVNEQGGEIINLPGGSQVIPHDVSMEMARNAGGGGAVLHFAPITNLDMRGSNWTEAQLDAKLDQRDENIYANMPSAFASFLRSPTRRGPQ